MILPEQGAQQECKSKRFSGKGNPKIDDGEDNTIIGENKKVASLFIDRGHP